MQLEKYDDRSDRSHSLSHVHMVVGIEPDPIPAIEIAGIVTIAVIVKVDVSSQSLSSLTDFRCALFGIPQIQISLKLRFFFQLQHSISYSRIFKLEFYFMKQCFCRESNSRLLIDSTVSYPLDHQDNDAGKCKFLVIIF